MDNSKFNKLDCDLTLLREGKLQRFLQKLKMNGEIDNETYNNISEVARPARIYGNKIFTEATIVFVVCPLRIVFFSLHDTIFNKTFVSIL